MKQTAGTRSIFVQSLRESAPYVRCHSGRLFVVHIDESLLDRDSLRSVCGDLLLLHQLQVRLVVVFGVRSRVDRMLREKGMEPEYSGSLRVTDRDTLEYVRTAAAGVRDDMESMLSTVALHADTPPRFPGSGNGRAMARVTGGNFIVARPAGVISGRDLQYTGHVRGVDVVGIHAVTGSNSILLLPPLGYGHTGELFNLDSSSLASRVAVAVDADKLVFLLRGRLCDSNGQALNELQLPQARQLLQQGVSPDAMQKRLELAIEACAAGVPRAHFVDQGQDGALLLEMYSRDGSGTLISSSSFDEIRSARLDDLAGILQLIEPLSSEGVLIPRPRQRLEESLVDFTVLVRDGLVVACAALRHYPGEELAEISCLAVHPGYRGTGKGITLHNHLLRQAQQNGSKKLLVMTTQALHWFYDLGYSDADDKVLPASRRGEASTRRGSRILLRNIEQTEPRQQQPLAETG